MDNQVRVSIEAPLLTSQVQLALITSDSEMFQFWLSAESLFTWKSLNSADSALNSAENPMFQSLKIRAEQRWSKADSLWNKAVQRWTFHFWTALIQKNSALISSEAALVHWCFLMFSDSALS